MKKIFCLAIFLFLITTISAYGDYAIYYKDGREFFVKNYKITEVDITYITDHGIFHLPLKDVDIEKTEYERDMADHGPKWQELQKKEEEKRKKGLENPVVPANPPLSSSPRPPSPSPAYDRNHDGSEKSPLPASPSPVPKISKKEEALNKLLKLLTDDEVKRIAGIKSASLNGNVLNVYYDKNEWDKRSLLAKNQLIKQLWKTLKEIIGSDATVFFIDPNSGKTLANLSRNNFEVDGIELKIKTKSKPAK